MNSTREIKGAASRLWPALNGLMETAQLTLWSNRAIMESVSLFFSFSSQNIKSGVKFQTRLETRHVFCLVVSSL
jgi:hypothetical protein